MNQIKPKLGRFDLIMLVVSLVIGMGIFRTPVSVAQNAGSPTIFFAAWILGGVVSFFGALTYAEIGSRYPVAGGFYKIFSVGYHPAFAFMVNWLIVFSNAGAVAGVAIIGAEYINPVIMPQSLQNATGIQITSISAVVVLFAINFLGIRASANAQNVLTIVKILLVGLLCLAIFGDAKPVESVVMAPKELGWMDYLKAFSLSFIPIFFTFGGYQQSINFGSDVKDPQRSIPRGIFVGMTIVLLLYMAINYAYYKTLGFSGLQNATSLTAQMAGAFFGETGFRAVSVLLFISVLGFVNSSMMYNPRIYYAMAEDGILPSIFKRVNPRTQVQEFALIVYVGYLIITLLFIGTFEKLIDFVMLFDSIGMITSAAVVFILRKRAKPEDELGIYKMKFFPLMPVVFILVYTLVAVSSLLKSPQNALWGLGLFLLGLPMYWFMRKAVGNK